jgi:toxin FitB
MILLDTNVLSALMRRRPDTEVIHWLDRQARTSVWTTSVTVLEIRFGLQTITSPTNQISEVQKFGGLI